MKIPQLLTADPLGLTTSILPGLLKSPMPNVAQGLGFGVKAQGLPGPQRTCLPGFSLL